MINAGAQVHVYTAGDVPKEARMSRFAAVVIAASLSTLACHSATAAEVDAGNVWLKKCQGCHGEDGKAKTKMGEKHKIPDISTAEWHKKHTDDQIKGVISNGVPDT